MKKGKVKKKVNNKFANVALIAFLLIVGIVLGAVGQKYIGFFKEVTPVQIEEENFLVDPNMVYINVPAVDNNGNGVSTALGVKVEEGTGKTLVDIDSLLFWVDTQNSIRMAKLVAEEYTGIDTSKVDITYMVNANASLIGGESAGSALAIATVAALQNKPLKKDVMITGTVNHDGTIGPIGGILEKANAAKGVNIVTFLVPLLQSREITYEESEHCETFGLMEWCTIERIPVQVDIEEETGIDVIEVGTIEEAVSYFIE